MSFSRLPSNSEQLLAELVQAENPTQVLCNRFGRASQKEADELRSILKELRLYGYIDIKWAGNFPYFVMLNNSARTYHEELTKNEFHNTTQTIQAEKVNPIIFMSHRSTDKAVADMLTDFFSGTGISRKAMFCSSLPGNDINERISGEVRSALRNSAVNIVILSQDYYQSAYCLNEEGVLWYQDDVPVIPIALPEINSNNMYGFLNNEYKLRRLDSDTDISYIYDVVSEAVSALHTKVGVITYETQKLRERYASFLETREEPTQLPAKSAIAASQGATKDEVKQKISNEFFSLLLDIKTSFRTLGRCLMGNPNNTMLFEQNLTNFNQSIGIALEYYNDYKLFLKDYSSKVAELNFVFDEYIDVGRRLAGSALNDKGRKTLESYINKLYELSCSVADLYMRKI